MTSTCVPHAAVESDKGSPTRALLRNPFTEWLIMILAVMAGFVAMKFLASYLPDGGFTGAFKTVVTAA